MKRQRKKYQSGGSSRSERVLREARRRLQNNDFVPVPEDIQRVAEQRGEGAYSCIGGVCTVLRDAGITNRNIWSNTQFEREARDIGLSNPVYGLNNLEPGDVIQWRQNQNKSGRYFPSHAQIYLGKNEDGKHEFFDNHNEGVKTYSEERLKQVLDPNIGEKRNRESAQILKLNPSNASGYSSGQRSQEPSSFGMSESPVSYSRRTNFDPNSPLSYFGNESVVEANKNRVVEILNDKDLDKRLREQLRLSDEELQRMKPLLYGIMGQESNFGSPDSLGAQLKYGLENAGVTGAIKGSRNVSMGPAQTTFKYLDENVRKEFGINDPNDLKDFEKSYVAAANSLNNARKYVNNYIDRGKRPELADKDEFERALYWYNNPSLITKKVPTEEEFVQNFNRDYNPSSKRFNDRRIRKEYRKTFDSLNIDPGSYPHKVLQRASDLIQDFDFEQAATLPEVIVRPQRNMKKGGVKKYQQGTEFNSNPIAAVALQQNRNSVFDVPFNGATPIRPNFRLPVPYTGDMDREMIQRFNSEFANPEPQNTPPEGTEYDWITNSSVYTGTPLGNNNSVRSQRQFSFNPNVQNIQTLGVLNAALSGISNRFANDRRLDYANRNLNNPYSGILPYNNARPQNVAYGYRNFQRGGLAGFSRNNLFNRILNRDNILEAQILNENPALQNIGNLRNFRVLPASEQDKQHLRTTNRNPEYFGPGDTWYPLMDDLNRRRNLPYRNRYRTLVDDENLSPSQVKERVALDFISHGLQNDPNFVVLSNSLESSLIDKYGRETIEANGGVAAYIRSLFTDSPEYLPYTEELSGVNEGVVSQIRNYVRPFKKGGTKKYQFGNEFEDPFEELFESLFNDEEPTKEENIKPPTTSEVDRAVERQRIKQMRKSAGRDIVNNFTPEAVSYFEEEEDEDFENPDEPVLPLFRPNVSPVTPEEIPFAPQQTGQDNILERYKAGIAAIESGGSKDPYNLRSKSSSALGKYQFIEGTRDSVRKRFFPNIPKEQFEQQYRRDPQFQESVMDAYSSYLLEKFQDPNKAAIAHFLGEGKVNKVNDPDYRPTKNNATVGQYLNRFQQGFQGSFMKGGTYHVTPEQMAQLRESGVKFKMLD